MQPTLDSTPTKFTRPLRLHAADGTYLFHADWGSGPPVVFVAGWAMPSSAWDYQRTPLAESGFRCIAYDRRGHGRSDQAGTGYNLDTLSEDLATVLEQLDLHDVTLVGHSLGACEIVRYLSRHGQSRVARLVLVAPATPGATREVDKTAMRAASEQMRSRMRSSYPQWIRENARAFVVESTSEATIAWGESLMYQTPLKVALDTEAVMLAVDLTEELRRVAVPALVVHGDRDVSAPLAITGQPTADLLPRGQLRVIAGAPHGLMWTHSERVTQELITFAGAGVAVG